MRVLRFIGHLGKTGMTFAAVSNCQYASFRVWQGASYAFAKIGEHSAECPMRPKHPKPYCLDRSARRGPYSVFNASPPRILRISIGQSLANWRLRSLPSSRPILPAIAARRVWRVRIVVHRSSSVKSV